MMYPRPEIKIDTKNHRKNNFNLTTTQFFFSKYKTIKGLHMLNCVCWVFDKKKLDFLKYFQKLTSLWFHFNNYTWTNMIFEMCNLISEQERLSNKKNIDRVCKILDRNDINTSRHSLKSWPLGGYIMDPEKENKQYSDQLGEKKDLNNESMKSMNVMFSIWQ